MTQKIKFEKNPVEKNLKTENIGKKELAAPLYHRINNSFLIFYPLGAKFYALKQKKDSKNKHRKTSQVENNYKKSKTKTKTKVSDDV